MLLNSKREWEIKAADVTPESAFRERRNLVKIMGLVPICYVGLMAGHKNFKNAAGMTINDSSKKFYPAQRNSQYQLDRPINSELQATTFNNFYEFGSHKKIAKIAQKLKIRPWTITFDGMVERKITIEIDSLISKMQLEERLYRFRCVEAWSMAVPWTGFPMADLIKFANPLKGAKFVSMETFYDPEIAPGQKQFWYPWPYLEALTIEEATNELALIGTGVYGKPLPKQMGSPLRLVVPWKYGFKSIKSIVRFTFTNIRPIGFWERIQGTEYGFWANVNPRVDHPRWSQAKEEILGAGGKKVKTLLYNGYAKQVAYLYEKMQGEQLFR